MSVVLRARQAVEDKIVELGYEIVAVEMICHDGNDHLTFFVDCPQGITLDDCELISNAIDPLLDQADPTLGKPYMLDVSSPGLDRPFVTLRDFERNYGRAVEVRLKIHIDRKDTIEGELVSKTDTDVVVKTPKKLYTLPCDQIFFVRPLVKFK